MCVSMQHTLITPLLQSRVGHTPCLGIHVVKIGDILLSCLYPSMCIEVATYLSISRYSDVGRHSLQSCSGCCGDSACHCHVLVVLPSNCMLT